ncbi:MAG: hypothetical protein OEN01_06030 [Candidatus Krumholzibacteria bacterium]|nr:hypothetical protein [Candidatus Krumholzibacteria bacterium]
MRGLFACVILVSFTLVQPCYGDDSAVESQSQVATPSDSLRVWQSLFSLTGFKYEYDAHKGDVGMGGSKVKEIVRGNQEAFREVQLFGRFQVPSFFITVISAGVAGWGVGSDNESLIYGGLGGVVVGFIIDQIGYSHLKKGVRVYNDSAR